MFPAIVMPTEPAAAVRAFDPVAQALTFVLYPVLESDARSEVRVGIRDVDAASRARNIVVTSEIMPFPPAYQPIHLILLKAMTQTHGFVSHPKPRFALMLSQSE